MIRSTSIAKAMSSVLAIASLNSRSRRKTAISATYEIGKPALSTSGPMRGYGPLESQLERLGSRSSCGPRFALMPYRR